MENLFDIIAEGNIASVRQHITESNVDILNAHGASLLQDALKNKQDEIALHLDI